jgi:hypothetical protein
VVANVVRVSRNHTGAAVSVCTRHSRKLLLVSTVATECMQHAIHTWITMSPLRPAVSHCYNSANRSHVVHSVVSIQLFNRDIHSPCSALPRWLRRHVVTWYTPVVIRHHDRIHDKSVSDIEYTTVLCFAQLQHYNIKHYCALAVVLH